MCAFIIIMHSQSFSDQCPSVQVDNRSYVLASHERLPVHMDLPTSICADVSTYVYLHHT